MNIDKRKLIGGGILATSLFLMVGGSDSEYIPTFLSGGGGGGQLVESSSPDTREEATEPKVNLKLSESTGDSFLDSLIQRDASRNPDRSYNYNPKSGVVKISDASGNVVGGLDNVNMQSITADRAKATFNNNPVLNAVRKSSGGSSSSSRASGGGSPKTSEKVSISTAKDPVKREYENKNMVSTTKSSSDIKKENKIRSLFGGKL